jgi:hypothetical protein
MAKVYTSFVVRCWVLKDQPLGERSVLDVEHVQSGERLRAANFTEASAWMDAVARTAEPDPEHPREPPSATRPRPYR